MRMQTKLMIVFVFIGLFSCVTVGSIGYYMVKRDFHQASKNHAFEGFTNDFIAYVGFYGSLENALAAEKFDEFVRRIHKLQHPKLPNTEGRTPLGSRWENPPFRHLVLSVEGRVILPAGGLQIGERASQDVIEESTPIIFKEEVIALGSTIGDEVLTPQDKRYLQAVRHSLYIGTAIALVLSFLLAFLLGSRLSKAVRDLTKAVKLMHTYREDVWQVEVTSNDELGELTESFNAMNVELANAHTELRELAIKDPLTNLYNRRHFEEQAQQIFEGAKRYDQPLSVMIGDLDFFKKINDTFSHEVGDLVLEKVAELFEQNTRKSDVVARYGGEEFVVLFANTDSERASISCENIRQAIEAYPWSEYHPDLTVTLSMGLCGDKKLGNVSSMISKADKYLYEAKSTGRNRLVRCPNEVSS